MAVTDTYRRQHADFVELVGRIQPMLDPQTLPTQSRQVREMLSTLFGKLSVHLAMEDSSLYPRCQKHSNDKVREIATRFANEMSGHKSAVDAFGRKWTENEIRNNAALFSTETKKLFSVLNDRINRENREFYTLIDAAG